MTQTKPPAKRYLLLRTPALAAERRWHVLPVGAERPPRAGAPGRGAERHAH